MKKLVIAILLLVSTLHGQASGQTLGCSQRQLIQCELWEIRPCPCEVRRVQPAGPSRQHGVNYVLDKTIGLTALSYMDDDFPGWDGIAQEIESSGFDSAQLWMDIPPYCEGQAETGCEADLAIFQSGLKQVFIKSSAPQWQVRDGNCFIMDTSPQPFILYRLYEMGWWRDVTVVLTRWEQDWLPEGCPNGPQHENMQERLDQLIEYENRCQKEFEEARAFMMKRYPDAKLTVLRSMTVNQFPGYNVPLDHPTVAEAIGRMKYPPDIIGISYWKRGMDPTPALDWLKQVTGYPATRMFVVEFGGRSNEQAVRFNDYIPAFWNWGIRTILIWTYEDNWDDKYTVTEEGLEVLRELMR